MSDRQGNQKILILTALQLEIDAILRKFSGLSDQVIADLYCHRGLAGPIDLTVACLHGMGNVNSAAKTAALIQQLRPRLLLLVGIAGGTQRPTSQLFSPKEHFLGDVLVAEQIIDYEAGKIGPSGTEHRFRAFPTASSWTAIAKALESTIWTSRISVSRPDGTSGRIIPRAHLGTFASGEKVIKNEEFAQELKEIWTQLVAVEMEGLGVALACHQTSPPTEFLLVKAICDWADPTKSDLWQPYAADAAAAFAAELIAKFATAQQYSRIPSMPDSEPIAAAAKLEFVRRLADTWMDLADALGISPAERARFERGDEPRAIWEWLDVRNKLRELPGSLRRIGRADLAEFLENPRSACLVH